MTDATPQAAEQAYLILENKIHAAAGGEPETWQPITPHFHFSAAGLASRAGAELIVHTDEYAVLKGTRENIRSLGAELAAVNIEGEPVTGKNSEGTVVFEVSDILPQEIADADENAPDFKL